LDTLLDVRDNKVYKIVKLNGIRWMVDNLDFKTDYSYKLDSIESLSSNLTGRYYPYFERDSICPNDWTLPNSEDWSNYFQYIYDSLGIVAEIRENKFFYPSIVHKIELKPNYMVEGGKLVETGTAHYWTANKHEEYRNKPHDYIIKIN